MAVFSFFLYPSNRHGIYGIKLAFFFFFYYTHVLCVDVWVCVYMQRSHSYSVLIEKDRPDIFERIIAGELRLVADELLPQLLIGLQHSIINFYSLKG